MNRRWHITLYNTRKTRRASGIWKICCWIHMLALILHSCIIIHNMLVLDGSLHYVQCVPCWAILQIFILFSMTWYCRIQSPVVSKQQDVRWFGFRRSIPLSIEYIWSSSIDRAISTPSCSYCIWNRHCQNHRSIHPNFVLFAWLDTLEFIRVPCPKSWMYDYVVFDDRFQYELTYVWSVYSDRAISSPWYLYCI